MSDFNNILESAAMDAIESLRHSAAIGDTVAAKALLALAKGAEGQLLDIEAEVERRVALKLELNKRFKEAKIESARPPLVAADDLN